MAIKDIRFVSVLKTYRTFGALCRINPVSFFVVAALLLGAVYFVVRPPMQSPDEFNHFARAYQISEGKFLPEKKDQRLGGEVPICFNEFMSLYMPATFIPNFKFTHKDIEAGFDIRFSDKQKVFRDFPNTSYYSPVSYIPQSAALFVLRQFNCSVGLMYHASRLFVFFVWVFAMLFVIKTLPIYKWLFVMILLIPMNLYLLSSFTADTVTNILSFIFIAIVLKHTFSMKQLTGREFFLLFLLSVLLALSKTIYVGLLALLLIIPATAFKSTFHKYALLGLIVISSFLAVFIWSETIMTYFISFDDYNPKYRIYATLHEGVDYHKQKAHLIANGSHIFTVLYNTGFNTADFYLSSYIGRFGTYMDALVPSWFVKCAYIFIIFVALTEKNYETLSWSKKMILFFTAILTFCLIILSQHLIWNSVGRDIADSIQGRYLVPVLPLVFMLFNVRWSWIKLNVSPIVIAFVLLSNAFVCHTLYLRFFKENYTSKTEIACGAEEVNNAGYFKTSESLVLLAGGNKQSTTVHRNGKCSIMLPPDSSRSAVYTFKDLRLGDLVEIYAWQKGDQGEIVVEGKGLNCEAFHFVNKDIQLTEKNGWKKMQMIFPMFVNCDSSEVKFYVQNLTRDTIYFDDLKYSVKKFN